MMRNVATCDSAATLAEVARMMRDRDIGDVLVTEGEELRGIVTDRDIVVRCIADDADPTVATVVDACSDELVTVTPEMSLEEAARVMAERAVRRLPVVDDGRPVGVVSIGDVTIERDPTSTLAEISVSRPNN
jgi:CBS domain-containing protein